MSNTVFWVQKQKAKEAKKTYASKTAATAQKKLGIGGLTGEDIQKRLNAIQGQNKTRRW